MEKEEFIQEFSKLLNLENPQKLVNERCRQYLVAEVKGSDILDKNIEEILVAFANHFSVSLTYDTKCVTNVTQRTSIRKESYALFGFAGVASIATIITESAILRTLGCGAILFACIFASKKTYCSGTNTLNCLKIKTTPTDVYMQLKHYENIIDKLKIYNSLEGYDKGVLAFLQQQYCESRDEEYKMGIKILLQQCGYEFIDYSDDFAGYFESSVANVEKVTTTYQAIKSNHSGYIAQRGHVVFPLNKK